MICHYGCGKEAQFQLKNGNWCCSKRPASCEEIKNKNSKGLKDSYQSGKRSSGKQQYQSLSPIIKEKMAWSKGKKIISNEEIFTINSFFANEYVKSRISKDNLLEYKCSECDIDAWRGKNLILDLDHINGINTDNRIENLRYLCPNCHSLTHTYKGRNKNNGRQKVSDSDLINAYKKEGNIRRALISVGLTPKGANYTRMNNLLFNEVPK